MLYDLVMAEYSYTVSLIENELTYEQLFMFARAIIDRKVKQASSKPEGKAVDIQDIAEGKTNIDFPVERVTK